MGARYTKAQAKATAEYMKDKHTIKVIVTEEKAEIYKAAAKAKGYPSLSRFIIDCIEKNLKLFQCENCGNSDASERTDLEKKPVLCDECYGIAIFGDCNCDKCRNSYYEDDRLRCSADRCHPSYDI